MCSIVYVQVGSSFGIGVLCTQTPGPPRTALLETERALSRRTKETKDVRRSLNHSWPFLTQDVLRAALLRALFQAQGEVDPVDDADDDGLPGDQVSEPIEQLPVQDVCLLPADRR